MSKHFRARVYAAGLLLGASACSAYAGDADGQRDVSIYDQNPACLERGQLQPGQASPCVLPSPPSDRYPVVRAPASGSTTSSTTGVVQGGQSGMQLGGTGNVTQSSSGRGSADAGRRTTR